MIERYVFKSIRNKDKPLQDRLDAVMNKWNHQLKKDKGHMATHSWQSLKTMFKKTRNLRSFSIVLPRRLVVFKLT